ncbi:MAG: Na/Pi symporter, partial [Vicinamibacterales bacterium]|nr:Na/Pi symporter [Vicinamibacterales bacterium]
MLLPLELATGFLQRMAVGLGTLLEGFSGFDYDSPFATLLSATLDPVERLAAFLFPAPQGQGVALIAFAGGLIFATLFLLVKVMRTLVRTRVEMLVTNALRTNALFSILVGVVVTVMVRSSSITTSLLVPLGAAGLLRLEQALPITIGANIGTTITNTLVSLGHARRSEEFRRAFAAATMHDFFNILAVLVFFPLEVITGFLTQAAEWLADVVAATGVAGGDTRSPIKEAVKAPVDKITDVLDSVVGSDELLGVLLIAGGIALIFAALMVISRNMRILIAGRIERAMNVTVASGGGAGGLLTGFLITLGVQSSSITTSITVPLVGSGVLALRNAFPITVGANMG